MRAHRFLAGQAAGADMSPQRLADVLTLDAVAAAAQPEDALGRVLDHCRDLEMGVGGIGIAGAARGELVGARAPGREALGRRPDQEEGRADRMLDRRLHLGLDRVDDPPQPPDPARPRRLRQSVPIARSTFAATL